MNLKNVVAVSIGLIGVLSGSGHSATGHRVTVMVNEIADAGGSLHIALFLNEQTYNDKDGAEGIIVPVDQTAVVGVFNNIPQGDALILLFHDINDNGRLDSNFLGIPREPYASSTGKRGRLGPPSWDKGRIEIRSDTTVEISLR